MHFGAGNVISLVVAAIFIAAVIVFFARRKSFVLAALYTSALCVYLAVYVLSWFFGGMELATSIADICAIALIVSAVAVYQAEIKSFFFSLAKMSKKQHTVSFSDEELQKTIEEIVKACQTMSKARTGALIVVVPTKINQFILDSGVELGAVQSIFNTRAPMHDGAVVVKGNKVLAAGCFLPLSQTQSINKDIGTRHRAAIGITEESDNLSIVVSEENGIISVAKKGILRRYITPERLSDILYETYGVSARIRNYRRG